MDQPTIVIISMLNASTSTIATRSMEGIFIGVVNETTKKEKLPASTLMESTVGVSWDDKLHFSINQN